MPFYPGISTYLTDQQLWTIICTDPAVTNAQLAAQVGAGVSMVATARWRVRKHGWTRRVSYGDCRFCGQPFTRPGTTQLRLVYHPACWPLAGQVNRRAPDRRRWEALPVEERRDLPLPDNRMEPKKSATSSGGRFRGYQRNYVDLKCGWSGRATRMSALLGGFRCACVLVPTPSRENAPLASIPQSAVTTQVR